MWKPSKLMRCPTTKARFTPKQLSTHFKNFHPERGMLQQDMTVCTPTDSDTLYELGLAISRLFGPSTTSMTVSYRFEKALVCRAFRTTLFGQTRCLGYNNIAKLAMLFLRPWPQHWGGT